MSQLPEVMAIAGPNGSGKSTVTSLARTVGAYLNADDIKRATQCTDMEAAVKAEELLPQVIQTCDIVHVYDNSGPYPFRIFKKRKDECFAAENEFWCMKDIHALTGICETSPFPAEID